MPNTKYASFAPAASNESGEPTPGRLSIGRPLLTLSWIALVDRGCRVTGRAHNREAARHALREQGGAG